MTRSTKKKKQTATVSHDEKLDVHPDDVKALEHSQIQVIPSSYDALIITASVNQTPAIGFFCRDTGKLEVMSVVHFEAMLSVYMDRYVKPERKN